MLLLYYSVGCIGMRIFKNFTFDGRLQITDAFDVHQCEAVGQVADIIQIPAFLCRQVSSSRKMKR